MIWESLGIILPGHASGNNVHTRCPKCFAEGKRKKSLSCDTARGLFQCWRCGWKGRLGKETGFQPILVDPVKESKIRDRKRRALRRVWSESQWPKAGPVIRYLENRLNVLPEPFPQNILYHRNLTYWNDGRQTSHPAMLGIVRDSDGEVVTLHRTYLTQDGHKATVENSKKIMGVPSGSCTGAAIRLYPATDELIIAEGIETALSLYIALGKPVWSVISAHGMETVVIPEFVKHVIIGADNDENNRGQQAAEILKGRLLKEGRTVRLIIPDMPGTDWNDVLLKPQRVTS